MAFERPGRNPLKHSWQDTFGLVALAATILFPPFFLVGMLFIWLSNYWTRKEKLFATLLPLGMLALGWIVGFTYGGFVVPIAASYVAGVVSAVVAAFTLAFRSGLRDSQLPDPA